MKKILIILCLAFLLASCEEVVYTEPQPPRVRALKEFPDQLQGAYLDENLDTLHIGQRSIKYEQETLQPTEEMFLSDSKVLKSYRGRYFFSLMVEIGDEQYWLTYLLDPAGLPEHFDAYTMSATDVVRMAMLQEITPKVSDLESGGDKYYLFSPKKRHYRKIIGDTVFTKAITFTRIYP